VIVTGNLQDFPENTLKSYGIETQHPDDFLEKHLSLAPGKFCVAVRKVRARLRNPPYNAEDCLATLTPAGAGCDRLRTGTICRTPVRVTLLVKSPFPYELPEKNSAACPNDLNGGWVERLDTLVTYAQV
jgi:hypothetical protein